jgi:hypothetical protein
MGVVLGLSSPLWLIGLVPNLTHLGIGFTNVNDQTVLRYPSLLLAERYGFPLCFAPMRFLDVNFETPDLQAAVPQGWYALYLWYKNRNAPIRFAFVIRSESMTSLTCQCSVVPGRKRVIPRVQYASIPFGSLLHVDRNSLWTVCVCIVSILALHYVMRRRRPVRIAW